MDLLELSNQAKSLTVGNEIKIIFYTLLISFFVSVTWAAYHYHEAYINSQGDVKVLQTALKDHVDRWDELTKETKEKEDAIAKHNKEVEVESKKIKKAAQDIILVTRDPRLPVCEDANNLMNTYIRGIK